MTGYLKLLNTGSACAGNHRSFIPRWQLSIFRGTHP